MATCIRCDETVPLGSEGTCDRAPDRGPHEFRPHLFIGGRLDGRCGKADPQFGTSCGHERGDEIIHDWRPERLIAAFVHRNESLHRHHDIECETCSYCDLVGTYAVKALTAAGFRIVCTEALSDA